MVDMHIKKLEDIAWHFIARRIQTIGGMILQKETYDMIYKERFYEDMFKENDRYIEFGQSFETMDWIRFLKADFDIDDLLYDAIDLLDNFNNSLVAHYELGEKGTEIFEEMRTLIKSTTLIDVVEKISLEPYPEYPGKMKFELSFPKDEEMVISTIKNFLKTL